MNFQQLRMNLKHSKEPSCSRNVFLSQLTAHEVIRRFSEVEDPPLIIQQLLKDKDLSQV